MAFTVTSSYRTDLAQQVLTTLSGATCKLGSGRFAGGVLSDPQPSDTDLENATVTGLAVTAFRSGQSVIVEVEIDGGTYAGTYTEAGIFLSDASALLLDAFRPVTIEAGVTFRLTYTLFPEVP